MASERMDVQKEETKMTKKMGILMVCLLFLVLPLADALAVPLGNYEWEGYVLSLNDVELDPMLQPVGMQEGERAVSLTFEVPKELWEDDAQCQALYTQSKLKSPDGTIYAPLASMSGTENPILIHCFSVPQTLDVETMTLVFSDTAALPEEYVGSWRGEAEGITLAFTVAADGTGEYTFTQGGYSESYPFALNADDNTFKVAVDNGSKVGIASAEGTYTFADDTLTLTVNATLESGNVFTYTVPCERVE